MERVPPWPYLSGRCQRFSNVGRHSVLARVQGRIRDGLGIRSGLRRLLAAEARPIAATLGEPSRFHEGEWVRVLPAERIRQMLDARSRSRGLEFGGQQWSSCGRTYRVSKVVRRIIDDGGRLRAVSRTVLLDGVDCCGEDGASGCGRHCPMFFRDEWLELAPAGVVGEQQLAGVPDSLGYATVRPADEIRRTLDPMGRRGSLLFMPEMARFAGTRARILKVINSIWEFETWVPVSPPVYILALAPCSGAILGEDGPCDRACHLLWHRDWLTVHPPGAA